MISIKTPDQVTDDRQMEEQRIAGIRSSYDQPDAFSSLASMVRADWESFKTHKMASGINDRLLSCARRKKGEYEQSKLNNLLAQQGSTIYMRIAAAKCRTAKSWLSDLFASNGDKPFTLDATPVPDLPEDIERLIISEAVRGAQSLGVPPKEMEALMEKHRARLLDEVKMETEERTERMANEIHDLLVEGRFRETFDEFLEDFTSLPVAILKGLEFHNKKTLHWINENGVPTPAPGEKIIPRVRRVSPYRAYPSSSATNSMDGHSFIEHITFTQKDLAGMRGVPGYSEEALAHVINQYKVGGLREWVWSDSERAALEGRSQLFVSKTNEVDGLEWTGHVSGDQLIESGIEHIEEIDPTEQYPVSVLVIGNYVVRAVVNFDPTGEPDIFKACWQKSNGSFYGEALPEILADCEDAANGAARSLMQNMGHASGPQVAVDLGRQVPGADYDRIYPWKIWKFDSSNADGSVTRDPISFFQAQSNANELLSVYERFVRYGDEICGLPSYASGSDNGAGAAKTARGLNMLMNAASKNVKDAVRNIDLYVIEPIIRKYYVFLMLTSEDSSIKADAVPRARGSDSLIHKEESVMRQQEFLAQTANPLDSQIVDLQGRRVLLGEVAKSAGLPVDRIVPSAEELTDRMKQQMQAQQPQQQGAPE